MGPFNKERETMGRDELAEAVRKSYEWIDVNERYEITAGVQSEIVLGKITEVPSIEFTPDGSDKQKGLMPEARAMFARAGLGKYIEN